jgi:hypothetical protein
LSGEANDERKTAQNQNEIATKDRNLWEGQEHNRIVKLQSQLRELSQYISNNVKVCQQVRYYLIRNM